MNAITRSGKAALERAATILDTASPAHVQSATRGDSPLTGREARSYVAKMAPANLARVLRQYGTALETLRHSLGREEALPCDKNLLRECLIVAMAMTEDEHTRESLRNGYVLIEAFVPRKEYDTVRSFEESARRLRQGRTGLDGETLHELINEASTANERASAIESRVHTQMVARRRELAGYY
jgi:hypothetical protein